MSMSEPERHFHDRLQQCINNLKLPAGQSTKAKRMVRSAQRLLKDSYGSGDECYNFCFVAELMSIVEYLTQPVTNKRKTK